MELGAPSSSPAQDVWFSARKQGFESPWGCVPYNLEQAVGHTTWRTGQRVETRTTSAVRDSCLGWSDINLCCRDEGTPEVPFSFGVLYYEMLLRERR